MRDIEEAKRQCHLFVSEMKDNRPNCDDAGMARRILEIPRGVVSRQAGIARD
jgi:hypothetical protein